MIYTNLYILMLSQKINETMKFPFCFDDFSLYKGISIEFLGFWYSSNVFLLLLQHCSYSKNFSSSKNLNFYHIYTSQESQNVILDQMIQSPSIVHEYKFNNYVFHLYMPLASTEIVAPDVYWVGSIDWSVRVFHGYHTDEGTSYNAYLLMDEDVTLIDTVKQQFSQELVERITQVTSLDSVKYVIMNHAENDHSGALPYLMSLLKNATIVTNKICMEHLLLLYPELNLYPFKIVSNSTPLILKSHTIQFLQVPMLHWPDSMFSYCPEINTLFSNDGFGQHIACSERFVDQIPLQDHLLNLMREYTANIPSSTHSKPLQITHQTSLFTLSQPDTAVRGEEVLWNLL
ncbi:A-type_flavoprotein [Hexamita inflata]|uniref:A-type_flavoprotein n=1 Tax=Hexamita inflata TaxID=28002 RepID=A0ABP1GFM8_9EUKA